ncbi:MAG: bifunctional serine/threonine-protein kinase/formylglycine-generating enzyme family protein [bacterium]
MIGVLVGNYRITEEVGRGGMGVVYRAVHRKIESQVVAVKLLSPKLIFGDPEAARRAADEANSQARLRGHPNIVSLFDYVENEDGLFLILEYIAGVRGVRDLAGLVKARGALPPEELGRLFGQVLSAVGFAHRHGIVHRDLKPLNIMLTEFGAKVGDFGIARIVSGNTGVSVSGHRVGTPAYMSPEQVLDKRLDRRTDIYSLGCTLYEAATGRLPFDESDTSSFFEAHLQEPPIPPRRANPGISEAMERVILKAMRKKPQERFQSCEEFAEALENSLRLTAHSLQPEERSPQPPADSLQPDEEKGRQPPAHSIRPEAVMRKTIPDPVAAVPEVPHYSSLITHHPPRRKAVLGIGIGIAIAAVVLLVVLTGNRGRDAAPAGPGAAEQPAVSGERPAAGGMRSLGRNAQGYEEALWLKDSSVMVRIPAGAFTMGSDASDADSGEKPVRQVYLDAYHIDKHEVTNRQYKKFCDATGRGYPQDPGFESMSNYFQSYPSYPVVNVSWDDARAYADWAGKRLPTEAEWEKAARGTDGRKYPWGNEAPDAGGRYRANYDPGNYTEDGYRHTSPVGSFPAGASPYGLLDMAGNVWEWCNDWYDSDYYGKGVDRNPPGPSSGSFRVLRGGSWNLNVAWGLRGAHRVGYAPSYRSRDLGFRCAGTW